MRMIFVLSLLLSSCASAAAKKCSEWQAYESWYELKIGAVERHDTFRCTSFSEAP